MKLYGTTTSPFVRRVRVVAEEVGEAIERVDTATDVGMAALREVSPIRKVPVAVVDGKLIYDSHVIIEWLVTTRGWGGIAPPRDVWRDHNLINAIDAALDSAIQLFYLRRDGVTFEGTPYEKRQLERTDAIFAWLAKQLASDGTFSGDFGLPELALITTLDWMEFRKAYPTERASGVESVRTAFRDRASLVQTRPHT